MCKRASNVGSELHTDLAEALLLKRRESQGHAEDDDSEDDLNPSGEALTHSQRVEHEHHIKEAMVRQRHVSQANDTDDEDGDDDEAQAASKSVSVDEIAASPVGPASPLKTLYLIRHGESEANAARLAGNGAGYLCEDALLTPRGEQQARALLSHPAFGEAPPDLVLVSPLRRTMQTAMLGFGAAGEGIEAGGRGCSPCAFLLRPDLQETGALSGGCTRRPCACRCVQAVCSHVAAVRRPGFVSLTQHPSPHAPW